VFLVFRLLYHGINGIRLTFQDFSPALAQYNRSMFNIQIIVFLLFFIPAGTVMASEFYGGIIGGLIVSLIVLALPLALVLGATYFPFGTADVQVSGGNYRTAIVDLARSRGRPRSAFEFNMWLFMRVSGLALIFLALFHMFWLHFVISVEKIDFNTMISRWTGPYGALWRSYDLMLLAFAFTHGVNGARMVVDDYFHSPGWRALIKISLLVLWFVLMGLGLYIIFTFTPGTLSQ
jgi:succinate dehydrogenase / fumarate reductase membrane anchor subunit